jgi:hypothetical protein
VSELSEMKKTNKIRASKCDAFYFLMKLNSYISSNTMSSIFQKTNFLKNTDKKSIQQWLRIW